MREIVETKNVATAKNAVRNTLNKKGMLAIVGDIGIGKTTMYNILKSFWETYPHKFSVVEMKCFKSRYSRISPIMKSILRAIDPSQKIPVTTEEKYFLLRDELKKSKKNIILVADEAQDLNLQTFKDIKKIHEIFGEEEHLFSFVCFGKHDTKWTDVFSTPELGSRMQLVELGRCSKEELSLIAKKTFKLKFQSDRILERFITFLPNKTPLDIQDAANIIRYNKAVPESQTVEITQDIMINLPAMLIKYRNKKSGVTQAKIAEAMSKELGRHFSRQTVARILSDPDSPLHEKANEINQRMLNGFYKPQAIKDA